MADNDGGLERRVGLLEHFAKWTLSVGYFRGLLRQCIYFSEVSDFEQMAFFQKIEADITHLVDYKDGLLREYNALGMGMQYKTSEAWDYEDARRPVKIRPNPTKNIAKEFEKGNPVIPKTEDSLTDAEFSGDISGWLAEQIGHKMPKAHQDPREVSGGNHSEANYEVGLELLKAVGQMRISFYEDIVGFRAEFVSATSSLRSHLGSTGESMAQAILYDSLKTLQLYEQRIMPESFQTLMSQYPKEAGRPFLDRSIQLHTHNPKSIG